MAQTFSNIDDYIASFPADVQPVLTEIRRRIAAMVPEATETISYAIATFKLDGKYLVYFAGYQKHVSIYPVTDTTAELESELAPYRSGRGTVKFALDKPIPYDLIERIVAFLLAQRRHE